MMGIVLECTVLSLEALSNGASKRLNVSQEFTVYTELLFVAPCRSVFCFGSFLVVLKFGQPPIRRFAEHPTKKDPRSKIRDLLYHTWQFKAAYPVRLKVDSPHRQTPLAVFCTISGACLQPWQLASILDQPLHTRHTANDTMI